VEKHQSYNNNPFVNIASSSHRRSQAFLAKVD